MREIEIKARVANKQELINKLSHARVVLSAPIKQHDVVYGQKGVEDNTPGSIWLRVRIENDTKTVFTLKKQYKGGLDSVEHETEVVNAEELLAIIDELGFVLYSDLTKYRQKVKLNEIEICVDEVEGLGIFIEAERIADINADGSAITHELWSVLENFGVDRSNEVLDGYDVLMNRQKAQT